MKIHGNMDNKECMLSYGIHESIKLNSTKIFGHYYLKKMLILHQQWTIL